MSVFEKIEAQQKGIENTAAWMVGEQLKDICRREPGCAEILEQDLEVQAMSLTSAEAKIKEWADKQKRKGNCVVVPPQVAENILRKFYGLPPLEEATTTLQRTNTREPEAGELLRLEDFL